MATRIIKRPSIKIEVKDGKYKPFIFDNGKKCYLCNSDEPEPPTPPVPPIYTNRLYYTVVKGGSKPESTWITTNCSDNVFDAETGEGYLELNEGVTELATEFEKPTPNIFNDGGDDTNIATVVIPSQITSIGQCAFYACSGLTSVTIPNSVTSIGESAFDGCSGLTSVMIPNSVTSIGRNAFNTCSELTSLTIPDSVTVIGDGAFSASGLTSVTIPDSVTVIDDYSFAGCWQLTSVTIPNTVTIINNSAFYGCTSLAAVELPSGISGIGTAAFVGCTNLASVTCFATTPPKLPDTDVFKGINTTTCGVPEASISAYEGSSWYNNPFTTFVAIPENP